MARRCPSCGAYSRMGNTVCSKCGSSLAPTIEMELSSMRDFRFFAIVVLIFGAIETSSFVLNILHFGPLSAVGILSLFSTLSAQNIQSSLTMAFLILEIISVATILVQTISIVYLRASFSKLAKGDYDFSSPKTGTALLIIGLILAMIGVAIILALIVPLISTLQQNSTAFPTGLLGGIAAAGFMSIIGGVLMLVGFIMGVFMGIHRLAVKFEEPLLDYGWILLLVSLFFSPLGIVSGILFVEGEIITRRRLKEVLSGVAAGPGE